MHTQINHIIVKILFLILLFCGGLFSVKAQTYIPFNQNIDQNNQNENIIYYKWYNGIQMIELVYTTLPSAQELMDYDMWSSTMNSIIPEPQPYSYSVYVFRNKNGEILSVFNVPKDIIKTGDFIHVDSLDENTLHFHYQQKTATIKYDFYHRNSKLVDYYFIYDVDSIPKGFTLLTNEDKLKIEHRKRGVIDSLGNVILPPIYDEIYDYDSTFLMTKNKKYSFLSRNSNVPKDTIVEYDKYKFLSSEPYYFAVQLDSEWGIVNSSGKLILSLSFQDISLSPTYNYTDTSKFISIVRNNKIGLLNFSLNELFPTEFTTIRIIHENKNYFFIVGKDEKLGIYNAELNLIAPFKYDRISLTMGKNAFIVEENEKYGVLDFKGNVIVESEYDMITAVGNNTYTIHKDNKYGIYDINFNEIYPLILDDNLHFYSKGIKYPFYIIKKGDKFGVYNSEKQTILEAKYFRLFFNQSKPYFVVTFEGKKGILDENFKEIIQLNYEQVYILNAEIGLYAVGERGKMGVINSEGEVVIPFEYDKITRCNTKGVTHFIVIKNQKTGIIDSLNHVVLTCKFDRLKLIVPGKYYIMQYNKKIGAYNMNGKEIIEPIYDNWSPMPYSYFYFISKNNKWGVINPFTLEEVVPAKYRKKQHIPYKKVKVAMNP